MKMGPSMWDMKTVIMRQSVKAMEKGNVKTNNLVWVDISIMDDLTLI